jgi:alanyl-tRNA synthetase
LALAAASGGGGAHEEASREVNGTSFMVRCLDGLPAKQLRGLVDDAKQQIGSGVVVFIGIDDDKAGIAVGVTDDLTDKYDAVTLVQAGSQAMGGKGGGGRADMAQAGGPDVNAADAAITAIEKLL